MCSRVVYDRVFFSEALKAKGCVYRRIQCSKYASESSANIHICFTYVTYESIEIPIF